MTIDGQDPRRAPDRARARIGWLSHHTLLYDDLTAHENLVYFAKLHGVARPDDRASALLAGFGLADRAQEPVAGFSRGMQQRVALARALLHEPALLLLDEPSSGLDTRVRAVMSRALTDAGSRGATWILATHDVEEGLSLCPRWIALNRGRVIDSGASAGPDAERVRALVRGVA